MPEQNSPENAALRAKIVPVVWRKIERDQSGLQAVIVDIGPAFLQRLGAGKARIIELAGQAIKEAGDRTEQHVKAPQDESAPYVFARLQGKVVKKLASLDLASERPAIAQIRPDLDDGKIFNPDNLISTVISIPMLRQIDAHEDGLQPVMIEINVNYKGGRQRAKERIERLVTKALEEIEGYGVDQGLIAWKNDASEQYVYARLQGKAIRRLAELDATDPEGEPRAIYHIWPDFRVRAQIWKSVPTVKGDACRRAFATTGAGIVWALLDSGVDGNHPHFAKHQNLILKNGLKHMDFTAATPVELDQPTDDYGHGTHVAGIIAGELDAAKYEAQALMRERDPEGRITYRAVSISSPVLGVAPECKLVSYKVLDNTGEGEVSTIIAAIQKIQEINGYGRQHLIHGVNLSLGYDFDPEWFACGCSPICVEVDRLVRSGVAVVIAAGNTGKGFALTINDPGNAELAITVGATHREMPHRYGVSYFSSKGPTGDGRRKPDLLAPGEKIVSCGAGPDLETFKKQAAADAAAQAGDSVADVALASDIVVPKPLVLTTRPSAPQSQIIQTAAQAQPSKADPCAAAFYLERSGTSMAAPHVSGVIAGLLSVRSEFIGQPDQIKKALIENATDLGRDPNFQGRGLVDMMRTIQAI